MCPAVATWRLPSPKSIQNPSSAHCRDSRGCLQARVAPLQPQKALASRAEPPPSRQLPRPCAGARRQAASNSRRSAAKVARTIAPCEPLAPEHSRRCSEPTPMAAAVPRLDLRGQDGDQAYSPSSAPFGFRPAARTPAGRSLLMSTNPLFDQPADSTVVKPAADEGEQVQTQG